MIRAGIREEHMRNIDLRISDAMKRLADSDYQQQAIRIDESYGHIEVNQIGSMPFTQGYPGN